MNLSLRARLFIFFSILILVVLAIVLVIIVRQKPATQEGEPATTSGLPSAGTAPTGSKTGTGASTAPTTAKPVVSDLEIQQNAARQAAKIFTERYGSYSTDSNYENIRELETLATTRLWSSLSRQIKTASQSAGFVGVTTKVFSSEIANWKTDSAQVTVMALKNETKDGATTQSRVTASVGVIKSGGKWLVSDFAWQK